MRQRLPVLVLLGSSLAFLAGLYLPWRSVSGFVVSPDHGWSANDGALAGLFALALAASAVAALASPALASRMPFGRAALGVGYFGAAAYLQLRELVPLRASGPVTSHTAYGAYIAVGCGLTALLAAAALRRERLLRRPSATETAIVALGAGVLVSFLLPWQETVLHLGSFVRIGSDFPPAVLAAVLLCLGANLWRREAASGDGLALAVGVAVLVGAAFSLGDDYPGQRYGAWVGLGCALALAGVAGYMARARRPALPSRRMAATAAAAALLLVSLFLPWETFGSASYTASGWSGSGSLAGVLALALLAFVLLRPSAPYPTELVAAIAVFTVTEGFQIAAFGEISFGYGAYVGFAAVSLLLLGAFRTRPRPRDDVVVRTGAVAACLAYLVIAVVPQWQVLPLRLLVEAPDRTFWLTIAGILLSLRLLFSWLRRPPRRGSLLPIPLAMLVLSALDLVRERNPGVGWGGIVVVLVCLFLALLGWIERGGDARRLRLPELLRVDRLPETET